MFPRFRRNSTARTDGRDDEVLVAARAVEDHPVRAVLAFDDVARVAGIPGEAVVARAEGRDVVALISVGVVVPRAPDQLIDARSAEQHVVPRPAVEGELDRRGGQIRCRDRVVTAEAVDDERVGGSLRVGDPCERGQAGRGRTTVLARDRHSLAGGTAVERDHVRRPITGAATERRRQIDVEVDDVRCGEVVHDRVVRTAEGPQVDVLGAVDVHHDIAGAAEEAQPLAVSRGVEVLARP